MYKIYTKAGCSYCCKAKSLLETKGLQYEEIPVDDTARQFLTSIGAKTVPQIFVSGIYIGGYNELVERLKRDDGNLLLG